MHLNSKLLFQKYAINYFSKNKIVLEIGASGMSEYQKLLDDKDLNWHTLELVNSPNNKIKNPNHFETNNEYIYPLLDNTYDIVFSGQVAEHVKKPWLWFKELKRIVKPGGYIITISPVSWPYHEDPVDCWRMYPDAMQAFTSECELIMISSTWENLEWEYFNFKKKYLSVPGFTLPGKSLANDDCKIYKHNVQRYNYNAFLSKIPFARRFLSTIQISYDTITIMQKSKND